MKRWIAKLLGIKPGLTVTIPHGAVLIMPYGSTIDTLNVVGGEVYLAKSITTEILDAKIAD